MSICEMLDTAVCLKCKHYYEKIDYKKEYGVDFENMSLEEIEEELQAPHYRNYICPAFPYAIPSEIFKQGHSKPRHDLGQGNDLVFEPLTDSQLEEIKRRDENAEYIDIDEILRDF